jgi:hypothetical protein
MRPPETLPAAPRPRRHYRRPGRPDLTACGLAAAGLIVTTMRRLVTCPDCRRKIDELADGVSARPAA